MTHVLPLNLIDRFKDYLIDICRELFVDGKNTHIAHDPEKNPKQKNGCKNTSTKQISTRVHILSTALKADIFLECD